MRCWRRHGVSCDPQINLDTQALLVLAEFPNPDGSLRNGQRLRTRVQLDARELPSVPFAAVTQTSGQSFVFRLGTLRELEAQPGKADLDRIKKGIERGVIPSTSSVCTADAGQPRFASEQSLSRHQRAGVRPEGDHQQSVEPPPWRASEGEQLSA